VKQHIIFRAYAAGDYHKVITGYSWLVLVSPSLWLFFPMCRHRGFEAAGKLELAQQVFNVHFNRGVANTKFTCDGFVIKSIGKALESGSLACLNRRQYNAALGKNDYVKS
jgi:hypothetical protein